MDRTSFGLFLLAIYEKLMKIAYTYDQLLKCGGTRVAFEHCRELRSRGHQADIYCNYVDPAMQDWVDRYGVRPKMLANIENEQPIDVIISCWWRQMDEVRQIPAKRYFHLVQGRDKLSYSDGHLWRDDNDKAMHRTDFEYLAVSDWAGESCRSPKIVPNGVDCGFWKPAAFNQLFDKFIVLLEASTSDPYKGLDEGMEAITKLRGDHPDKKIEAWLVTTTGFPTSFNWDRIITGGTDVHVLSAYQNASVLLKTTWFDGFGLPHLEAMACNLPLVTTDAGGNMTFCHHDQNCLVVKPQAVDSMVMHLQDLMASKTLRQRLAQNGMMTARKWTWQRSIDALLAAIG